MAPCSWSTYETRSFSRRSSVCSSSSSSVRQRSILSSRSWTSASNSASRSSSSLSRSVSWRTRASTTASETGAPGAAGSTAPLSSGGSAFACSAEISTRRTRGWDLGVKSDSDIGAANPASPLSPHAAIPRPSGFGETHPQMRILVAEDETIIRLDLRALLERAGFEVCAEARDGEEAVELARSEQPDVAVLDVKMPKLDGIEAARRILDERPIPIVMLTAYGQDELVQRAAEAGVFGSLVKPFREQDLLPAIRTARARHEELVALREEAESLADALAARKAIERAKGLLMEKEGLSEGDAFARLRKASQISGRPLKVVAEALIATLES